VHFQYVPTGGAVLQVGQVNPARRGILAMLNSVWAFLNPAQQFIAM
jgi:hypothetical protein